MNRRMTRLLQLIRPETSFNSRRYLINFRLIGLDDYRYHHKKLMKNYGFNKDTFIMKIARKPGRSISQYDLFRILHLAETDSDIERCIHAAKRYLSTPFPIDMDESDPDIGPLLLRMLHHLKRPDVAMKVVNDRDLASIFKSQTTSLIYMDLLYETMEYDKLVEFFFEELKKENEMKGKQLLNRNHSSLCMAALYKINTKESLEKSVQYLFQQYHRDQTVLSHRTKAFAAVLAANQGDYQLAIDILDLEYESTWVGNFNTALRMQFLAKLNRLKEALIILANFIVYKNDAETKKGFAKVFPDCLEVVKESVEKCDDLEYKELFNNIQKRLISQKLIHSKVSTEILNTVILNSREDTAKLRGVDKKSISRAAR